MKRRSDRRVEPVGPISFRQWQKENPPKGDFQSELKSKLDKKLKEKKNADQKEKDR